MAFGHPGHLRPTGAGSEDAWRKRSGAERAVLKTEVIHADMQLSPAPFDRTGRGGEGQGALHPEGAPMRACFHANMLSLMDKAARRGELVTVGSPADLLKSLNAGD